MNEDRGVVGHGRWVHTEIAQPLAAVAAPNDYSLRRDVGIVGLLFASLGSIIGAGWLFGALYASQLAGPAAIISWVFGGGAIMLLALTHAELGATYPVSGGSARFPHYAFGSLVGFTGGWGGVLGAVRGGPRLVWGTVLFFSQH